MSSTICAKETGNGGLTSEGLQASEPLTDSPDGADDETVVSGTTRSASGTAAEELEEACAAGEDSGRLEVLCNKTCAL